MPYATNADIPADVKSRYSERCQTVWRTAWNEQFARDQDEQHAFAVAQIAADNCTKATKSADDLLAARAVKFIGQDTIEGPIFTFDRTDVDGERFTRETDFCLDWFGKSGRPILYEHGLDAVHGTVKVGRQVDYEDRGEAMWAAAELDRSARYRKTIDRLIDEGRLGYSGGAMGHLAKKDRAGNIKRFPWVEGSLTPTPAEPSNLGIYYVKSADAIAHLEEVDIDIPAPVKVALAALDEWATEKDDPSLPDGLKFTDLVDRLSVDGPPWVKARKDWYAKSGRVLSAQTRERLMQHPTALRQLADDLDELLSTADAGKSVTADALAMLLAARETERIDERLASLHLYKGTIQ